VIDAFGKDQFSVVAAWVTLPGYFIMSLRSPSAHRFYAGLDCFLWSGGTSSQIEAYLSILADMEEGTYTVGLWIPDAENSLRNDVRYAVRFANTGVWDGDTGIHATV